MIKYLIAQAINFVSLISRKNMDVEVVTSTKKIKDDLESCSSFCSTALVDNGCPSDLCTGLV